MIALVPGKLYALPHPYSLARRVSTHPVDVGGTTTMNSYLLVEDAFVLLVDAGMTVHEQDIEAQLSDLVPERHELSILPTRVAEYASVCAVPTLAKRFNVKRVFGTIGDPLSWVDFRPEPQLAADSWIDGIAGCRVGPGERIAVDPGGHRPVDLISPPLRLLPSLWAFDEATGTLFTSDVFSHLTHALTNGRAVIGEPSDLPETEVVFDHMVRGRYWWLPGAHPEQVQERLGQVFESHDVQALAPAFGAISEGPAVARQYEQLVDVLAMAAEAPPAAELIGTR